MTQEMNIKEATPKEDGIRDMVCGMNLTGLSDLTTADWNNEKVYFCGEGCRERFFENPERFRGEPIIKLRSVEKLFHLGLVEVPVLRGLDLNIWEGDFVSIIGASGSGKSTVLNLIGLLDRPTKGTISFRGKDVSILSDDARALFRSKTFGFVFQQYNLIPWLTAYENASLPLIFSGEEALLKKLNDMSERLGLKDRMAHRPFELSGGEQQRTALLRALANDPAVILGDEPTGNLDSETGKNILNMLIQLNREEKKTLIIVTHDATIAEMADEIITIKDGRMLRDHRIHKKLYTGA